MRPPKHTPNPPEPPADIDERDRIMMRAICDCTDLTMSLRDLGFSGMKWAKSLARVRKRFDIKDAPVGCGRLYTPDMETKEQMRAAIADTGAIRISSRQNEVLQALSDGDTSSDNIADKLGLPRRAVTRTLRKLRDYGLVRKQRLGRNDYVYSLVAPYQDLQFFVSDGHTWHPVSDDEARYYAILRNSGLTGHRLADQHIKVFSHRTYTGVISHVRRAAVKRGWCR